MAQILKHPTLAAYAGCDAVVQLPADRADTPIKMLQITKIINPIMMFKIILI